MIPSDESEAPGDEEHAAALGKRSRILLTVFAVIAVIAVIAAVVGFVQARQAKRETDRIFREETSLRLVAEAQSMLAHTRFEGDVRAFQQLIVARRLAQTPDDCPLRRALEERMNTLKVIQTPRPSPPRPFDLSGVNCVAFSPDGKRIASGSVGDTTVRLWNAETGQPVGQPLTGHTGQVLSVAFSPDGKRNASASNDDTCGEL